jgi:hypothetical protein
MLERLLREAGFVFWDSDEMGTGIDWGCDYTKEMEVFANLLVDYSIDCVETNRELIKYRLGLTK